MADNKQTVLTDEQNAIIAARFPDDPANAVRAQSAVVEILSKLHAAGEPSDDELLKWAGEEQFFLFCDEDDFLQIARAVLQRYAAPQASAEESAIDKPIPDSVEHYGLIDERVGAPAADAGRTDARRAQPKRRPYNASASLSEYGIFPECDAAEDSAKGADVALPPLPVAWGSAINDSGDGHIDLYSADQMRAYALAAQQGVGGAA